LRPKQRLVKVRVKNEAQESHFMLSRVWENEPPHSQVNSRLKNWSSDGLPKSSKGNFRGQNSLDWKIPYTIGNLLKRRCLKWAHMTHLGT
jgi:hypothetical protein